MTTIAVVGPDGAGKTTVAKLAVEESDVPAAYLYMGHNPESHRFALPTSHVALAIKKRILKKRFERSSPDFVEDVEEFSDWGHVTLSDHPVVDFLRAVNRLFESAVRALIALAMAASGRVVITDRHFAVDHGINRLLGKTPGGLGPRIYSWAVVHFLPRPDLVIYLEAPAAVLYERKREGGLDYLERTQRNYRQASTVFPAFEVVDATQPIPDVVADVVGLIENLVQSRKSRQKNGV